MRNLPPEPIRADMVVLLGGGVEWREPVAERVSTTIGIKLIKTQQDLVPRPGTTPEEIRAIGDRYKGKTVAIVTDDWHQPRVLWLATKLAKGVNVIPVNVFGPADDTDAEAVRWATNTLGVWFRRY